MASCNINGVPVRREPAGEFAVGNAAGKQVYHRYIETLPNGRRHEIIEIGDTGPLDNTNVYTVPRRPLFHDGRQSRQLA